MSNYNMWGNRTISYHYPNDYNRIINDYNNPSVSRLEEDIRSLNVSVQNYETEVSRLKNEVSKLMNVNQQIFTELEKNILVVSELTSQNQKLKTEADHWQSLFLDLQEQEEENQKIRDQARAFSVLLESFANDRI